MINALILLGVIVVIVAAVILADKLGPDRLSGPDDRRDHTPPNPGREGR